MDFLQDYAFLQRLNQHKVREYWVSIGILDFQTERLLSRIEGKVISGNMTVAASSPTRRSGTLNIVFDENLRNITDINNMISIDKKVQINIGITNPYYNRNVNKFNSKEDYIYNSYGETLWFPQGVFIITKATSQCSTSSAQISINFVDKMALLNGTCGGVLPATVSFHELVIVDENGNTSVDYPLISTIIRECVQHYGGEHPSKIIVSDIEDVGRQVVKYQGSTPIRFETTNDGGVEERKSGNFVISQSPVTGFTDTYFKGDIVGYLETPLTFPGELIKKAGATVTQVLDDIVNALGNFEYFYDVDGVFHFQKKKNYLQTGDTPLNFGVYEENGADNAGNPTGMAVQDDSIQRYYLPVFQSGAFLNEFSDNSLVASINFSPQYENIKNDFIVWGTRNSKEGDANVVRYHLAIDERPKEQFDDNGESVSLCNQYIYAVIAPPPEKALSQEEQEEQSQDYKNAQDSGAATIITDSSGNKTSQFEGTIVRYQTDPVIHDEDGVGYTLKLVCRPLKVTFPSLPKEYWYNWREELYRMALMNYGSSVDVEVASDGAPKQIGEHYFEELRAEWRQVFNPESSIANEGPDSFESQWNETFGTNSAKPWIGYNVDIAKNPGKVRYWLDIIDSAAEIGKYSIARIGRRSVVKENSQINELFQNPINDIVFLDASNEDWRYKEQLYGKGIPGRIAYYNSIGQTWCILSANMIPMFEKINSYGTCFEDIRQLVYQNLVMNSSVTLTSIPLFYLDVNKLVRLNFPEQGIRGDYSINQITWNLGATATMNLSLQEALVIN